MTDVNGSAGLYPTADAGQTGTQNHAAEQTGEQNTMHVTLTATTDETLPKSQLPAGVLDTTPTAAGTATQTMTRDDSQPTAQNTAETPDPVQIASGVSTLVVDTTALEAAVNGESMSVNRNTVAAREGCPRCQSPVVEGARACPNCGLLYIDTAKTTLLTREDDTAQARSRIAGGGLLAEQHPIIFEIEDSRLELPVRDQIVIGRASDTMTDDPVDVALNEFGASKKGVSRRHAVIRRRGPIAFISDLDSTNGTYLNGRRVLKTEERILRDGDEIHFSHLLVKVRIDESQG